MVFFLHRRIGGLDDSFLSNNGFAGVLTARWKMQVKQVAASIWVCLLNLNYQLGLRGPMKSHPISSSVLFLFLNEVELEK